MEHSAGKALHGVEVPRGGASSMSRRGLVRADGCGSVLHSVRACAVGMLELEVLGS